MITKTSHFASPKSNPTQARTSEVKEPKRRAGALRVRSGLKSGGLSGNHSARCLRLR